MKNEDTKMKAEGDNDKAKYMCATHADLIELTRRLWSIPFGDLTKLHKDKAKEFGATSPTTVWLRAIIFARLADQERRRRGTSS